MKPLDKDTLAALRKTRQSIGYGFDLTPARMEDLLDRWLDFVEPDQKDDSEDFTITLPDGEVTDVHGPRWVFHLFGLAHRASHVGLRTPSGLVLLQRRSPTKADWPGAWDMAVAGHVPWDVERGRSMSYLAAAIKETEEELGLPRHEMSSLLMERELKPIGKPHFIFEMDESRNPPFYNAEVIQNFAATLSPAGLAALQPDYEELSGVHLCPPEEAWDMLVRETVASGMRYSLPRFLDWMMQNPWRASP